MTRERGAANIRKFNNEREERTLPLVEHELQLCRKRKLGFKSIGLLASYLSDRTSIHRTTLTRNPKYRVLLAVYMQSQPGAASFVQNDTDDPYVLKAKLAGSQAELGTLRQEVKRLTARLARSTLVVGNSAQDGGVEFANLCALLCVVLSRVETFAVDTDARTVLDLAARPSDRIVAGPERAAAFVSWMQQNDQLPFVKSVRIAK